MKHLEIQPWAAIHLPFSRTARRSVPALVYFSDRLLDAFATMEPGQKCLDDYDLALREREILRLMADGLLKKEIAEHLNLSVHTVSTHLRRVYGKLHVQTNTGAVAKALREKII